LTLVFGLAAAVFVYGMAEARADGKVRFSKSNASIQIAALESHKNVVDAEDLSHQRAMGLTPGTLSAPSDDSKVAVILWDDAWSELQRRVRSASTAAAAGPNAGTSIAGSSGTASN
jgi:hypothetical protein